MPRIESKRGAFSMLSRIYLCAVFFLLTITQNAFADEWGNYFSKDNLKISKNGQTVFDKSTKLTWMRCFIGQVWNDIKRECSGEILVMSHARARQWESNGWRLPTLKEALTIKYSGFVEGVGWKRDWPVQHLNFVYCCFWLADHADVEKTKHQLLVQFDPIAIKRYNGGIWLIDALDESNTIEYPKVARVGALYGVLLVRDTK